VRCGGLIVRIRSIDAADATFIQEFVAPLSSETRYLRFMAAVKELSVPLHRIETYATDGGWPPRNHATIPRVPPL
jgi:hypothetical protein